MRYSLIISLLFFGCGETTTANNSSNTTQDTTAGVTDALQSTEGADAGTSDSSAQYGPPAQNLTVELTVGGLVREYRLYVPSDQSGGPMPLLLAIHGGGGAGEMFVQEEEFGLLSEYERVIIAYPQGLVVGDNEGEWQLNTGADNRHDIDFMEAVIADVSARYTVDQSRVYAIGYSLGSMFVYELACQMGHRFAALASHAGTMPVAPTDCTPEIFTPIMHMHGANDTIIPYDTQWDWKAWDSVGTMHDIPGLIAYWQSKYGCQTSSDEQTDASTLFTYTDCQQGARIEHHRFPNAGHEWPTSLNGVLTPQVLWLFLSQFTLDTSTGQQYSGTLRETLSRHRRSKFRFFAALRNRAQKQSVEGFQATRCAMYAKAPWSD